MAMWKAFIYGVHIYEAHTIEKYQVLGIQKRKKHLHALWELIFW
jgi:hypothetical protein